MSPTFYIVLICLVCLMQFSTCVLVEFPGPCPHRLKLKDIWYPKNCSVCECLVSRFVCRRCPLSKTQYNTTICYRDFHKKVLFPMCCDSDIKCLGEDGFDSNRLREQNSPIGE
ncbi:uncharacterized protein LOC131932656 [Physella acuta]|uniref:uncharacterized protein LOC131932656 n=1 Tax=Physella acuta TaxID=109671 RepID=UPI0027DDAF94|nr:uncharacterized protein LOC131932656 [Physella acuta]